MKITSKIVVLLMAALLPVGFAGCSDDDDDMPNSGGEEAPEFVLGQESIKVKIGAENKVTVDIKQGGGEYDAFILDARIAKAEIVDGVIKVEGLANGQTSLMVSDKYNRYRKMAVNVYTTEKLQLSDETFDLITVLGNSKTLKAHVVLGNGGYEVKSDNPAVSVSINEEGEISMTATSKKADFTATVTVTDCTGLSASIAVTVKASLVAFTDEELEVIMADNSVRYYFNNAKTNDYDVEYINTTIEDGRLRYGWNLWGYYCYYIDFAGDKSVGTKEDASFTVSSWSVSGEYDNQPVTLKIVKNDGTNLWGTFSFINEKQEKLYTGYFCDTVEKE